jgi:WD40 repeat protein
MIRALRRAKGAQVPTFQTGTARAGDSAGAPGLPQTLPGTPWSLMPEHRVMEGHPRGVLAVAVSADGATMVSGSDDTTERVWDTSGFCSLAIYSDGGKIVSKNIHAIIQAWGMVFGD